MIGGLLVERVGVDFEMSDVGRTEERYCFQVQSITYHVGKDCCSVISYGSNVLWELVVVCCLI